MLCGVRKALGEWRGVEAPETPQDHAKTMRRPSEDLANNTLCVPGFRAINRLVTRFEVAGSAGFSLPFWDVLLPTCSTRTRPATAGCRRTASG